MDTENLSREPSEAPVQEKQGALERMVRVFSFSDPGRSFVGFTSKFHWLIPFIIVVIIGGIIHYTTQPIATRDMKEGVLKGMERYREQMPPQQFEQMVARITQQFDDAAEKPFQWYYPLIYIAYPLVFSLVISLVGLVMGNFIFGGRANFWIIMNVVVFASLIGLLGDVVRGVLTLVKDTTYVYIGLGLLKPINDSSYIYYLLRQVDVFTIWRIVVTAIGLGVIYNMKPSKFGYVLFLSLIHI